MTAALQSYADRGVFRGFRASPGTRGRIEYRFAWLTRVPMAAVFDPHRRALQFPSLFPGIDKGLAHELDTIITSRTRKDQPAHKRIDARRVRMVASVRKGDFSVSVEIRGGNHAYGVKQALNLINELFVMLHEHHPEYLIAQFQVSAE